MAAPVPMATTGSAGSAAAGVIGSVALREASDTIYGQRSLAERFGRLSGRPLQDAVFQTYQARSQSCQSVELSSRCRQFQVAILQVDQNATTTVPWFLPDGNKGIIRHPLNARKQLSIRLRYTRGVLQHGILEGCRGEPWLLATPG